MDRNLLCRPVCSSVGPCRPAAGITHNEEIGMSAYKIIEVVGTSAKGFDEAVQAAVGSAAKSLRNMRVAEVVKQDVTLDAKGKIKEYRARVALSFKYEA
jgi:flavin-binding protein dodecin